MRLVLPRQLKKACERPPHAEWAPSGRTLFGCTRLVAAGYDRVLFKLVRQLAEGWV